MNKIDELVKIYPTESWKSVLDHKNNLSDNEFLDYICLSIAKFRSAVNGNFDEINEIKDILRSNWRYVQNILDKVYLEDRELERIHKGRVCPVCGSVLFSRFKSHIESCNLTQDEYLLKLYNITEVPKCLNPECSNKVSIDYNNYRYMWFCCNYCAKRYTVLNGTNPWLHENLVFNELGKSILHIKINNIRSENGTHPFSSENLIRDEFGKSVMNSKSNKTRVENGTHNFLSQNLIRDKNGKSIMHVLISKHAVENGNHQWLSKNLYRDNDGKSIIHSKINYSRSESGLHPFLKENLPRDENGKSIRHSLSNVARNAKYGIGCKISVKSGDRLINLKSFVEFIYLLYLVKIKNINIKDISYDKKFNTGELNDEFINHKTDFLVNNVNYEIHPDGKESDKLDFFKYLDEKHGIKSVYIPWSTVWNNISEEVLIVEPNLWEIHNRCKINNSIGIPYVYEL